MKVLHLGKYYPPVVGGIELFNYDLVEWQNKNEIQSDVLCVNNCNKIVIEKIKTYNVYRASLIKVFASTPISISYITILKKIIKNYDVLHIHFPNPLAALAVLLSYNHKTKIVIHWHSDIVRQKNLLRLINPLINWVLKCADIIIGTTQQYINGSEQLKFFHSKCVAIPSGLNPQRLNFSVELLSEIKMSYLGKKIIFSIGRLVEYKGFEYLVKAAQYLDKEYIILIAGKGPLYENLLQLISTLNLSDKIKMLGYVSDDMIGSYLKAMDLFVLPSITKNEAFGLVQCESMYFGKPIVATNIKSSGVNWVNQNNITGLNVEPKNPKQLADAIKSILSNKEKYELFSKNAKKRFEETFNIKNIGESIKEIYEELLC